jgi:hypothetical protein
MLNIPLIKFNSLDEDSRKFILCLIREFSKPVSNVLGVEATEEAMIELIDSGFLQICMDENEEGIWLEIYDTVIKNYRKI